MYFKQNNSHNKYKQISAINDDIQRFFKLPIHAVMGQCRAGGGLLWSESRVARKDKHI